MLARWALRGLDGPILDPSFGGCSFLRAAADVLNQSNGRSLSRLWGIDVDASASIYATALIEQGVPPKNFIYSDFFACSRSRLPRDGFSAIIGNPPYVRHHRLNEDLLRRARRAARAAGFVASGQSDLWAYFVAHSFSLLKRGGRLALLVPGASLQTRYGRQVLKELQVRFAELRVFRMQERLFAGTDTDTVVLLADGAWESSKISAIETIENVDALVSRLDASHQSVDVSRSSNVSEGEWKWGGLNKKARALWHGLVGRSEVRPLSSLARIRIGVVTGANDFFLRGPHDDLPFELASMPIAISRASGLTGARWTGVDEDQLTLSGKPSRLLLIQKLQRRSAAVRRFICEGEEAGIAERHKTSARNPWYTLTDCARPDAFVGYMGTRAPRIVINEGTATCTNAIHRLWWRVRDADPRQLAVASCSSLFEVGAEVIGRSYGGGVLKLEPSELGRVPIAVAPVANDDYAKIDVLLRSSARDEARELADTVVLRRGLGLSRREIDHLRNVAEVLRSRRLRP